jgi:hypothetical protein
MTATKNDVLKEVLRLAKAKQGEEKEKCVELTASTDLKVLPGEGKKAALQAVADQLTKKYNVTFPNELTSLGTIDDVAEYIISQQRTA